MYANIIPPMVNENETGQRVFSCVVRSTLLLFVLFVPFLLLVLYFIFRFCLFYVFCRPAVSQPIFAISALLAFAAAADSVT